MSAYIPYRVKVLRLVEDYVIVDAVVSSDAETAAAKLPSVARVIEGSARPARTTEEEG